MFSLISGFIEYMTRKDEFHILILGIDNAGKTNLLERLKTLFTGAAAPSSMAAFASAARVCGGGGLSQ